MLSVDLLPKLRPPAGCVLIQRDERPVVTRGVWIPDRARHSARASTARVLAVSPEIKELHTGDRVLLGATVGSRSVRLGVRGEIVVEICRPHQIIALILNSEDPVEHRGEHPFAGFTSAELAGEIPPLDEGDPLAIQ